MGDIYDIDEMIGLNPLSIGSLSLTSLFNDSGIRSNNNASQSPLNRVTVSYKIGILVGLIAGFLGICLNPLSIGSLSLTIEEGEGMTLIPVPAKPSQSPLNRVTVSYQFEKEHPEIDVALMGLNPLSIGSLSLTRKDVVVVFIVI